MKLSNFTTIFDFITTQEDAYKQAIQLPGNWRWSMKEHIETSYLYSHSQLKNGKDDYTPVKNITRPILNLQHRAEDIEVKDVQIYVDDADKYHLSFLVKKYHDDVFVVENDIDTYFDELNISRIDYGGGLSKQLGSPRPEVVPLHSIAFCDQTDILSGSIGLKHFFSPAQLMAMGARGWGDENNGATATLEDTIELARSEKKETASNDITKTPGRYIEVYEVHGEFPNYFLDNGDDNTFSNQLHIVCFYQKKDGNRGYITLFKAKETKSPFKLTQRDTVYGRALGFGGAEELFEAQVWTNYDMIRIQQLLDAASKTILITQDPTLAAKHPSGLKDLDNLELLEEGPGGNTRQLDTFPRNLQVFENSAQNWHEHGKDMGGAQDPVQGKASASGTPFAALQAQIQQGMGLHDYRRGQFAKHLEEVYRDWIIPHIIKEITKGQKFLAELSLDEMQYVSDCLVRNAVNDMVKEKILSGELVPQEEVDAFKQKAAEEFRRKGNKHFIEILKGEFAKVPLAVKVDVAGKSKDLSAQADKITNLFRFAFANPQGFAQVMQIPGMAKSFNRMLESSGLSQVDFAGIDKLAVAPPPTAQQQQQPQIQQQPAPQPQVNAV